jgi:small subunit ribosomal protein S11
MEKESKKETPSGSEKEEPVSSEPQAEEVKKEKKPRKKKGVKARKISKGRIYVKSTYNNTVITVTDLNGNTVAWGSAGHLGFKGPKKATPYAAMTIMKNVVDKIRETGLMEVDVFVRGIGGGREAAIRAIGNAGLEINTIKDVTPLPHNGCRPKKVRRV